MCMHVYACVYKKLEFRKNISQRKMSDDEDGGIGGGGSGSAVKNG